MTTDRQLRDAYRQALRARTPTDRSGCASPEDLAALVDPAVPQAARLPALAHVATCVACQRDLALLRAAAEATRPPRRRFAPAWAMAASLALLVGAAGFWFMGRTPGADVLRGGQDGLTVLAPVGAVPAPGPTQLVWRARPEAARYEVEIVTDAGAPVFLANTSDTTLSLPGSLLLESRRTYRWWVTAVARDGIATRSPAADFEVQ